LEEGGIVAGLVEQGRPAHGPVEDVVDVAASGTAQSSRHARNPTRSAGLLSRRSTPDPFSGPLSFSGPGPFSGHPFFQEHRLPPPFLVLFSGLFWFLNSF